MNYGTAAHEQHNNFKWLDGSCSVPVDGYLCRYTFKGMCPAVENEGAGNALYSTPFGLLSTLLTHVPFGSMAAIPCPGGTKDEQSVLCMLKDDGTVGWSRDAPLCSDAPGTSWCNRGNGGCEHFCQKVGEQSYCECSEGFQLDDDGQTCTAADVCRGAPCEFECLPLSDGYRCACPEGYMLAPDMRGCLDVDECLQSPCEQLCVNAPGTFECRCRQGYRTDEEGECEDVDECMEDPCEHACENTPGSHVCHCHLGYSLVPEDPSRCQDTDECQIPGTCQQMCVNYEGGFDCYCEVGFKLLSDHFSCREIGEGEEDSHTAATTSYPWVTQHPGPIWESQDPMYHWTPEQTNIDWTTEEEESLDWLTEDPRLARDIWGTSKPQEDPALSHNRFLNPPTEEPEEEESKEIESTAGWETIHWNAPAKVKPEFKPTPSLSSPAPHTSPVSAPTPNWYYVEEAEEEYEATTSPSVLPTSTISEGATIWMGSSPTPTSQDQGLATKQGISAASFDVAANENDSASVTAPQVLDRNRAENQNHHTPSLPPPAASQTTVSHERGVVDEEVKKEREPPEENGSGQKQGNSNWLLVGLLVPICIIVVVMVALGIVYCTRCAAMQRNKTATDCYHWISGAHDKQGAPNPNKGMQSHV
ncbi:CD248 molecule, endosialin a [Esox lucius]|nr:CD248 molecule, endosialin a [Esox lucius]